MLVRAVKTRWNTVRDVLERAQKMRDILWRLCDKTEFNDPKSGGVKLRQYMIEEEEWVVLDQLFRILDVRFPYFLCRVI